MNSKLFLAFLLTALTTMYACKKNDSSASTTAAASSSVPDTNYVLIPANPSFTFTTDLTNTASTGETSAIGSAYAINKYLVTNAQYKAFLTATGGTTYPSYWTSGAYPAAKANHPVLFVSLANANAYCAWLGTQNTAFTFRLPTEAEFENAAKGPNNYAYPWGNSANTVYANGVLSTPFTYNGVLTAGLLASQGSELATYNNANSTMYGTKLKLSAILSISATGGVSGWVGHTTYTGFIYTNVMDSVNASGGHATPVGYYPAGKSTYGLYDMAGDAFEWTSSLIVAVNGGEAGTTVNAVRGGSWYATQPSCKTSYRGEGRAANGYYNSVGFRVVAVKK